MTICTLTPAADAQISALCDENDCYAISLNIKGGGCAGFEYDWGTMNKDEINAGDEVVACDRGNFVISSASVMFLIGTEVDYVKSIVGSNFEIRNPNAQSSCGCGVSVNFDMDKLAEIPDLASSAI
jgi:iron-sulfur cluster assembly accessory protein